MANNLVKCLNTLRVAALIVLLGTVHTTAWSCSEDANSLPVDLEEMSGLWYEVARVPESDVPACLKVIAPSTIENNDYILQLDYVNNVNKGWKRTQENITFPWISYGQNGIFNLSYSGDNVTVDINFKYMGTFNNFSLVCGYSGVASGISIIRLLSRNETVNKDTVTALDTLLASKGVDASQITWVEQGGRCNSGSYLYSSAFAVFAAVFIHFCSKSWLLPTINLA